MAKYTKHYKTKTNAVKYTKHYQTKVTPQSQKIPGSKQVANSAGGYSFAVDDWTRLERFLVLGAEGGSYYASERKLTVENAEATLRAIKEDGKRAVDLIVEISDKGRAPKNDPAIFALALAASLGDDETRAYALQNVGKVCRIFTHLSHFADALQSFRGWGRAVRRSFGSWYTSRSAQSLALQVVKYPQRDGWSHRDILRLAHPKPQTVEQRLVFNWVTQGIETDEQYAELLGQAETMPGLNTIIGLEKLRRATSEKDVIAILREYKLPREAVESANTEWLKSAKVWEVLLLDMPIEAMMRNLGVMTSRGLVVPMSDAVAYVVKQLGDQEKIKKARLHPIKLLTALLTYQGGHSRGGLTWKPVQQIVDALDRAFYLAFENVESTGKRTMLALDVSGSMSGGAVAGVEGLTPRVASAALALVTAAREPNHEIVAFQSASGRAQTWRTHHTDDGIVPLNISPRQRLDDVVRKTDGLPFGGTDCALPMLYALKNKIEADAFVIYTDSETWAGDIHPVQALAQYRRETNIPAKLIVVGMVSNGFSIADPNDAGMLDVVGFDTATPQLVNQFISQ